MSDKIGILTHFGSFQPGYALAVGWHERARMLDYFGVDFDFLVNETCADGFYPHQKNVLAAIPSQKSFNERVRFFERDYKKVLQDYKAIFTADLLYQKGGNFLPQNQALRNVQKDLKNNPWFFHWVHSGFIDPSHKKAYPDNLRFQSMPNSTMVYMNYSELDGLKKMYNTNDAACVWNPKDIRSFNEFDNLSWEICARMQLWDKDIVQIFPVCSTRMVAKGITKVGKVFGALKRQGKKVALIIANANANPVKVDVEERKGWFGRKQNLEYGKEVLFTSDLTNGLALSRKAVSDIFKVSNVFVFGSLREVCPNTLLEAKVSNNLLVINEALPCAREFAGDSPNTIYFRSGGLTPGNDNASLECWDVLKSDKTNYDNLAKLIIKRVRPLSHLWEHSFENIWYLQLKPLLRSKGIRV